MNFQAIWDEYRAGLRGFLGAKVSNAADADDLLQDILLKAYEKLPTLKSSESIKGWLYKIANHTIIDFYRANGRRPLEPLMEEVPDPEKERDTTEELSHCVRPFIHALPRESAQLLSAIELEGVSQKDYAEQNGIHYSTLKSKVQKSRVELRAVFDDCCKFSLGPRGEITDYEARRDGPGC